jgi:MFS family permease
VDAATTPPTAPEPAAPAGAAPDPSTPRAPRARALSRMTRYSWSRHWPAEMLMGISAGVINLTAFSLQRSMGAPEWTSSSLIILGQALWVLAPAWPPLLARMQRQTTFAWLGLFSRGPLLLMAFAAVTPVFGGTPGAGVGAWWILFAAFLVSNNLDALYTPHRNALIRANYPLTSRGRIYGLVTVVTGVASMIASQAVGHVLDEDPTVVTVVFPIAGVVGIAAHLLLARIRWRYDGPAQVQEGRGVGLLRDALVNGWRRTFKTLREDKPFRDFEIGFMLYGLGLLSGTPLIVSRFAQDSGFRPTDWANADRLALPLTQLLLVWAVGRLSDRIGVVRVGALAFAGLVPFFAWVGFVTTPTELLLSYILLGVCMSGVNVSWALGPLHFAPRGEAHHYSAVHVGCVGIRSVLGPVIGETVKSLFSYRAAMGVSAALELLAAIWMFRLARRVRAER